MSTPRAARNNRKSNRAAEAPVSRSPEKSDVRNVLERFFDTGVWLDFEGREALLERLRAEAARNKETVEQHVMWLIAVYIKTVTKEDNKTGKRG